MECISKSGGRPIAKVCSAVVLAASCLLTGAAAQAATITVNTKNTNIVNNSECGLREAVEAVNRGTTYNGCAAGNGINDQIVFLATLPPGPFQTQVTIDVLRSVTIVGASVDATIIETGAPIGIRVHPAATATVLGLRNLTLRQLATQNQPVIGMFVEGDLQAVSAANLDNVRVTGFNSPGIFLSAPGTDAEGMPVPEETAILRTSGTTISNNGGPGIAADGAVTVDLTATTVSGNANSGLFLARGAGGEIKYSTIEGNTSFGDGGGIRVVHSESCFADVLGNLAILGTTVSANRAVGDGGGLFWGGESGITVRQSTISGNSAARGGGLYNRFCASYFTLEHVTVALNTASSQGGGLVVDRSEGGSTVILNYSIFAKNTLGGSPLPSANGVDLYGPSFTGAFRCLVGTREGWDCLEPGSGPCEDAFLPSPGNVLDPRIGALGTFGGVTRVHPLLTGSPAIDVSCLDPEDSCADHEGHPHDQRTFPRSIFHPEVGELGTYLPIEGNGVAPVGRDAGAFELECPAELVTNPQFEVGTSGWFGSFGTTIARTNTPFDTLGHHSFHALRVSNRGIGTWQGAHYNLLGIAQPGNSLQASGWVRIENDNDGEPVLLTRRAVCSGGSQTFQTVASGIATVTDGIADWVYLTGTANIPNCNLTELSVYFEGPRTGVNLLVDEVSVFRGSACESVPTQLPLAASLPITNDWGSGFCAEVKIGNPNPTPTTNWSAAFNLKGATVYDMWNLNRTGSSGQITVTPTAAWSRVIPAQGASHSLGFCANRAPNSAALPSAPTVTGSF